MRIFSFILLSLHISASAVASMFSDPISPFDMGIAATAKRVYGQMNERWTYPTQDAPFGSESAFWKPVEGTYRLCLDASYMAKRSNGAPYDFCAAFDSLLALPARLECRITYQMAKIMCVRGILGDDLFNTLARQIWEDVINLERPCTFIKNLSKTFWRQGIYLESRLVGRGFYVTNLSDYKNRHPTGAYQGHNLMGVGYDQMVGFGEIFKDGPVTRAKVLEDLYTAYGDETLTFDAFLEKQDHAQNNSSDFAKTSFVDRARIEHYKTTGKL